MVCAEQKKRDFIEKRLSLNKNDKIEEALTYCAHLHNDESLRKATIEGKANTLMAATGVATAFMIGFFGLISRTSLGISTLGLIFILALYVAVVGFFLRCVYYALDTVKVRKYSYSIPDPEDIYNLKKKDVREVRLERAVDYLFSYFRNRDLNNAKATSLNKAQESLMLAIFLLAFLSLVFCVTMLTVA